MSFQSLAALAVHFSNWAWFSSLRTEGRVLSADYKDVPKFDSFSFSNLPWFDLFL